MATNRKSLRTFLIAQINSREIPGLDWLDEEKTQFSIPWFHKKSNDWQPEHCKLFENLGFNAHFLIWGMMLGTSPQYRHQKTLRKSYPQLAGSLLEWERYNGRYQDGVGEPNYVEWKTRMRCALQKSTDFELVSKENDDQQFRVYKVVEKQAKPAESSNACGSASGGSTGGRNNSLCLKTDSAYFGEPSRLMIPAIVECEEFTEELYPANPPRGAGVLPYRPTESPLPDDLSNLPSADLFPMNTGELKMSITKISIDSNIDLPSNRMDDSDVILLSDKMDSLDIAEAQQQQQQQQQQSDYQYYPAQQTYTVMEQQILPLTNQLGQMYGLNNSATTPFFNAILLQ